MVAFLPVSWLEEYMLKLHTPSLLIPSSYVFDGLSQEKVNRLLSTLTIVQTFNWWIKTRLQAHWVKKEFSRCLILLRHSTWGGVWERFVRSCKKVLNVVMQCKVLTEEALLPAITEVEALVNFSEFRCKDLEVLTPNHVLIVRKIPYLPLEIFTDKQKLSRKRWQQAQVVTTHIWKKCLCEDIPGLTASRNWLQAVPTSYFEDWWPRACIFDYGNPRGSLSCDRIVNVFPASDNVVRSTEVKTRSGDWTIETTCGETDHFGRGFAPLMWPNTRGGCYSQRWTWNCLVSYQMWHLSDA